MARPCDEGRRVTRDGGPKQVLVCAPLLPEFDREGGSRRIFHLLEALRQDGWAISYVSENPHGEERYVRMLQQMGIAVYRGFDSRTDKLFRLGHFDVAIFAFWYVAEGQIRRIRRISRHTKVIVDVIDLHWLRHVREHFVGSSNGSSRRRNDSSLASEMVRELNVYAQADAVLTVSDKEAEMITDLLGNRVRAFTVPDREEGIQSPLDFEDRRGILFVGNFRHPPNADAVTFFCDEVLPLIDPALLEEHPVLVVGNHPPPAVLRYAKSSPFVRVTGWVPSVVPYMQNARVSIVPMRYGAGTKRKLVQALMARTPTVTTSMGLEGLDLVPDEHVLLADDAESFAAATERLLRDRELWTGLADRGMERVTALHGPELSRTKLLDALESVLVMPSRGRGAAMERAPAVATAASGSRAGTPARRGRHRG
jgi:glycosyltransferase involved in cell wall biosynthesis